MRFLLGANVKVGRFGNDATELKFQDELSGDGFRLVFIWVYDDRLVFLNEGSLIEGLTPADLQQPHSSRRRNPTLAMAMFRGGLVETWGRGTLKMITECRAWGLPDPVFEDKQGGVWVTFFCRSLPERSVAAGRRV